MATADHLSHSDLEVLIGQTGERLGIDVRLVEKDYWVTHVLRALPKPIGGVLPVLKGGTSLSKGWGIIHRFSEDVDISLVLPEDGLPGKARDRALRETAAHVAAALGLGADRWSLEGTQARTGVYRNVRYRYEELFPLPGVAAPPITPGVLLEMAIRDAGDIHWEVAQIEPLLAATALELDPTFASPDIESVRMPVQRRERTLFEKLAHVHQVVVRWPDPDAERRLHHIGRHYYDIHALLGDEVTLQRLREPGTADRVAQEADGLSKKAGFPYVPRPEGGFGASPAFDADHPAMGIVRTSYQIALRLVFGGAPTLEECLGRVRALSDLL